ncbi:MAG: cupin domain-containing protein [Pseudomonadota bacterium]
MCELARYSDSDADTPLERTTDFARAQALLSERGVRLEQWDTETSITAGADPDAVLAAYRAQIDRLVAAEGYQSVDVVSIHPEHPDRAVMREKFLAEHTHAEDEVRFFVDGQGLFTLHLGEEVFEVLCERGELISVPANTPHWFDMGPRPSFVAVRLFNNPEGWVAHFTGSDIADRFHRLEN